MGGIGGRELLVILTSARAKDCRTCGIWALGLFRGMAKHLPLNQTVIRLACMLLQFATCLVCGGAQENVPEVSRVTFDDVKGCTEAKAELEEVVEFLKSPTKFTRLGGRLPKGILLTGPPGTGRRPFASRVHSRW